MKRRLVQFISSGAWFVSWVWASVWLNELGYSDGVIVLLAILHALTIAATSIIVGRWVDLHQPKWFAIGTILVASVAVYAHSLVTALPAIIVVRLIAGVGHGGLFPALVAWVRRDSQPITGLAAFGQLGWACGALSGGILLDMTSMPTLFQVAAFIPVIGALILLLQPQPASKPIGVKARNPWVIYRLKRHLYLGIFLRQTGAHSLWAFWGIMLLGLADGDSFVAPNSIVGLAQAVNGGTQFIIGITLANIWAPKKSVKWGYIGSALTFLLFLTVRPIGEVLGISPLLVMLVWQAPLGLSFALLYVGTLRSVAEGVSESGTATGLVGTALSASAIAGPMIAGVILWLVDWGQKMGTLSLWWELDYRANTLFAAVMGVVGLVVYNKLMPKSERACEVTDAEQSSPPKCCCDNP